MCSMPRIVKRSTARPAIADSSNVDQVEQAVASARSKSNGDVEVDVWSNGGVKKQTLQKGVRATPGGQHPGEGTRNALIALGPATYLEIGTRSPDDDVDYPDIDMKGQKRDGRYRFFHRNGDPYP